jgi:hypothetical protein
MTLPIGSSPKNDSIFCSQEPIIKYQYSKHELVLGPDGQQYVALYSGIGGDPGLPLEAERDDPYAAYG